MLSVSISQAASAAPGVGDFPLGAAEAGMIGIENSPIPTGIMIRYLIAEGNDSEMGRGHWAGTVFVRDYVMRTSIAGVVLWAVNESGTAVPKINFGAGAILSLVDDGGIGGGSYYSRGWANGDNITTGPANFGTPFACETKNSNFTVSANKYYFLPFAVEDYFSLISLNASIASAAVAGTVFRIAMWGTSEKYNKPKGLIAQTGNLAADVSGSITGTIAGGPILLPPMRACWMGVVASASITFNAFKREYFSFGGYKRSSSASFPWQSAHGTINAETDWQTNGVVDWPHSFDPGGSGGHGGNLVSNSHVVMLNMQGRGL